MHFESFNILKLKPKHGIVFTEANEQQQNTENKTYLLLNCLTLSGVIHRQPPLAKQYIDITT